MRIMQTVHWQGKNYPMPFDVKQKKNLVKKISQRLAKYTRLTGGPGARCISNGFSWKDSVVDEQELQTQSSLEKLK
jgi:hypothetical protein